MEAKRAVGSLVSWAPGKGGVYLGAWALSCTPGPVP